MPTEPEVNLFRIFPKIAAESNRVLDRKGVFAAIDKVVKAAKSEGVEFYIAPDLRELFVRDFDTERAMNTMLHVMVENYARRFEVRSEAKTYGYDYKFWVRSYEKFCIGDRNSIDAGVGASVERWELLKQIVSKEKVSKKSLSAKFANLDKLLEPLLLHRVVKAKKASLLVEPDLKCYIKALIATDFNPRERRSDF